jgi:hypothetical protein
MVYYVPSLLPVPPAYLVHKSSCYLDSGDDQVPVVGYERSIKLSRFFSKACIARASLSESGNFTRSKERYGEGPYAAWRKH